MNRILVTAGRTCDSRMITSAQVIVLIIPASCISRIPAWPYARSLSSDYSSVICKSKSCKGLTLMTVKERASKLFIFGSSAEFVGQKMMERLGSGSTGGLGEVHARRLRKCALKKEG